MTAILAENSPTQLDVTIDVNHQYQLIKLAYEQYQLPPEQAGKSAWPQLEKQATIAQQIIAKVLATPEAKRETVLQNEVEFMVSHLQQQFDHLEDFNQCLHNQGLDLRLLMIAIKQDLLCEKVLEAQSKEVASVSDDDARHYYQQNLAQFHRPEIRKVSHILITINDEYEENNRDNVLQKAQSIIAQLQQDITQFSHLAKANSECPTALNDGLVGEVKPGQLYPELDAVLFSMQPDTISDLVETELGVHILLCHAITAEHQLSEAEALPKIVEQMTDYRKKRMQKQWISQVMSAE